MAFLVGNLTRARTSAGLATQRRRPLRDLKRDRLSAAKRQRSLAVRIAKSIQGAAEIPRDSTSTFARPPEARWTVSTSFSASRGSGASTYWRSWKPRSYGAAMSAWPIVTLLRNNVQVATGVGGAAEHDSSAHVDGEGERDRVPGTGLCGSRPKGCRTFQRAQTRVAIATSARPIYSGRAIGEGCRRCLSASALRSGRSRSGDRRCRQVWRFGRRP